MNFHVFFKKANMYNENSKDSNSIIKTNFKSTILNQTMTNFVSKKFFFDGKEESTKQDFQNRNTDEYEERSPRRYDNNRRNTFSKKNHVYIYESYEKYFLINNLSHIKKQGNSNHSNVLVENQVTTFNRRVNELIDEHSLTDLTLQDFLFHVSILLKKYIPKFDIINIII